MMAQDLNGSDDPLDTLSRDEIDALRRQLARSEFSKPARTQWAAPRLLTTAERTLSVPLWPARYERPPKSFEELQVRLAGEADLWQRERERLAAWHGLGVQLITQHASETTYGDVSE